MSRRAVAPVVGVSLMVAVTVVFAAVVGAFAVGVGGQSENTLQAAISAEFGNEHRNQINLTHQSGDALDVRDLTVRIFVDGEPLEHQPTVPATAGMEGFVGIPSGAFHEGSGNWTAGEEASLTVATTTNSPQPSAGSRVTVKIYADGKAVTTARV